MGKEFDREREFKVWVEEIRSEVRKVAEGHGTLLREIQGMRADVGGRLEFLEKATVEGFGKVWQAVNGTNAQIDRLASRLDGHERAHSGDGRSDR